MKHLLVLSTLLNFFQYFVPSDGSLVLVSGYNSALNIFNITGDMKHLKHLCLIVVVLCLLDRTPVFQP